MAKNLVYILAILITTMAVSGGVIMAQQYQTNNSNATAPTLSSPTCPCGNGCGCAGQCHKAIPTP